MVQENWMERVQENEREMVQENVMEIVHENGRDDLAKVYVARFRGSDRYLGEFVDSMSGSSSRNDKWVAILSSQFGCPVGCRFCDAGDHFDGNMTSGEMLAQLDHMVRRHHPDGVISTAKFKVQFARMGEPALNPAVLEALSILHDRYDAPGLMPCISTVAPSGAGRFFEELLELKKKLYDDRFQLQFSVHSTDENVRDWLIPHDKWNLGKIAEYGGLFMSGKGRKVTLNFALSRSSPIDATTIKELFDPSKFMLKLTPVNPTENADRAGLTNPLGPDYMEGENPAVRGLREAGFEVVVSIGDLGENGIGSNCGQVAGLWRRTVL
jgi:23S rRNA (adenine2503-C2)-methyltransferase